MEIIRTVNWMKQVSRAARAEGRLIGFVPTMGALHEGHLSLVRAAQQHCKPVVVSIFVNPTQFGPKEDLSRYPRPIEKDTELLESLGVDYLFLPDAAEIYPPENSTWVEVEGISKRYEGASRPGHFRGVATVVTKLLGIVAPRASFFGRKDAQQARLIQRMSADLFLDGEIVICPIVREADGLALSSRNVYLDVQQRRAATVLHHALSAAREAIARGERDASRLNTLLRQTIEKEPLAAVDYAEFADAQTFEPIQRLRAPAYALLAVFFGATRLLDNMLIEPDGGGFHGSL